ncbi:MAG: hypothetical protein GXP24_11780 [Planctomycetes bacterium]|nr:hypothetical protein [Planctomycetota bacterium]
MAKIATCPKCAKQLGLPTSIVATDRAECPECHAVFSLSETVQISLPEVRVLDPAEPSTAGNLTSKKNPTDALASNMAPLKSWEERLKNALALDSSSDKEASGMDNTIDNTAEAEKTLSQYLKTPSPNFSPENRGEEFGTEASVAKQAAPSPSLSPSPNFDFELDPSPPAVAEPKQKKVAQELPQPVPKPLPRSTPKASTKPTIEPASPPPKTPTKSASNEPAPGELASAGGSTLALPRKTPKQEKITEVAVQTTARRRVARSGFPKVAALAVGPVLGGVLGLYGLLWLGGAKADFVGLAQVLPASLLPVDFGQPSVGEVRDEAPLAETSSPGLMAKSQDPPATMKHDKAVMPAAATEPMPPAAAAIRIKVDEFAALVDAAEAALPEFADGDLSTPEFVKRKGQAYMALCRLAEHFEFAQQRGLAPAGQAKARQAEQLYQRMASQANLRNDLAHIAGRWWEYDERPSPGIFLAGVVQKAEPAGDGTLCWIKLSEQSTVPAIPVWLKQGLFQTGDPIGIVGSVISDPDNFPQGFSGGKQMVMAEYSWPVH